MKKIIALVLALIMMAGTIVLFSSCTNETNNFTGTNSPTDNILVCGVTRIPGLNEMGDDGNWTGFESEFAIEVGKLIGMEVKFKEIDWKNKYIELDSGSIDCIWNGFTANSDDNGSKRSDLVDFSYGYMLNQQCIVVKKSNLANYTSEESLKGKTAGVESGSAGAEYAKSVVGEANLRVKATQLKTFLDVKTGAVDFIVVDAVLANSICGQGDYTDLAVVKAIELESEIYAIGFKKGSELTAKVNTAIKTLEGNGKLMELAKKYSFENVLQVMENIEY